MTAPPAPRPASLVIPGRDCAATIAACLEAVVPMLERDDAGGLREIIFVDDGSRDETAAIVGRFPVRVIAGTGRGAGAARNLGWRAAAGELIWFVDADCVAETDALARLVPHLDDARVGGVGGSYGIVNDSSLLACLVHAEILQRHRAMSHAVDFLATFNVVYRRAVLEEVGGFDERYLKGQDAELAFRVLAAGYELRFELDSRVAHHHEEHWGRYLRTQRQQGYWRVWLHLEHRGHGARNAYSSALDHFQPPLAMAILAALPLVLWPPLGWIPAALAVLLLLAQLPRTVRLLRVERHPRYALYAAMGFVRAFWRGVGMSVGVLHYALGRSRRTTGSPPDDRPEA